MCPRIIDIPPSSPSLKRTRETKEKLPTRQILLSRATEPVKAHGNTSLWRIKTMVVAGSVNFLMKKGKEKKWRLEASVLCRFDAKLLASPSRAGAPSYRSKTTKGRQISIDDEAPSPHDLINYSHRGVRGGELQPHLSH